ncbi:FadR family transcriptional regulator [Acetobacteraceae bacterium H6797]|nr:FadR family transcriptional regulator [Acetobacteraceae bacterium H6797]
MPDSLAKSLADTVYDELRAFLGSGEILPGRRLPGEHEMAERLAVSRPVLRQALARLRAEGWIETRKGSGTTLRHPPSPGPAPLSFGGLENIPDVRALLEFRCGVESEMAARAAMVRDAARVRAVREAYGRLEAAILAGELAIEEDIQFHAAVAAASANRFYVATLAAMAEQVRFSIRLTRELSPQSPEVRFADNRREHEAIVAALEAGDEAAARQAMTAHLRGGIRRLFGTV